MKKEVMANNIVLSGKIENDTDWDILLKELRASQIAKLNLQIIILHPKFKNENGKMVRAD